MNHNDKNAGIYDRCLITSKFGVTQDVDGNLFVRCPSCLRWNTLQAHGLRVMPTKDGEQLQSQSWCKACRSSRGEAKP